MERSLILSFSNIFFFGIVIHFYFLGAFRLYDVDNDGYITRQEMYDIVDAIYQMVVRNNLIFYLSIYCVCLVKKWRVLDKGLC